MTVADITKLYGESIKHGYKIRRQIREKLWKIATNEAHLAFQERRCYAFCTKRLGFSWLQAAILDLHIGGNSNKDIMGILGIRRPTMCTHVERMAAKAGCPTLQQMSCQFALYLIAPEEGNGKTEKGKESD